MSRLIDADALTKDIEKIHCANCDNWNGVKCKSCDIGMGRDYINDAPTVEERKHGHWIFYYAGDDWGAKCSICGNSEYGDTKEEIVEENPYCRKCGAIMDEVSEDD